MTEPTAGDWTDEIAERFRAEWSGHGAVTDCPAEFKAAIAAALRAAEQRGAERQMLVDAAAVCDLCKGGPPEYRRWVGWYHHHEGSDWRTSCSAAAIHRMRVTSTAEQQETK